MIRDLRGVIERERVDIAVPRIQIVTIEQAMALRDRAVRLPLARENLKRAVREVDRGAQGALEF